MLYVNPLTGPAAALVSGAQADPARQRLALQEMEHMFLFTLLQEMRKSVPPDPLLGSGSQRGLYEEMFDDAISGEMARTGQFGLAAQIERQLTGADLHAPLRGEAVDLHRLMQEGLSLPVKPVAGSADNANARRVAVHG
jgi:flagellar protein FlgJ